VIHLSTTPKFIRFPFLSYFSAEPDSAVAVLTTTAVFATNASRATSNEWMMEQINLIMIFVNETRLFAGTCLDANAVSATEPCTILAPADAWTVAQLVAGLVSATHTAPPPRNVTTQQAIACAVCLVLRNATDATAVTLAPLFPIASPAANVSTIGIAFFRYHFADWATYSSVDDEADDVNLFLGIARAIRASCRWPSDKSARRTLLQLTLASFK
jgi:hypothetical protein